MECLSVKEEKKKKEENENERILNRMVVLSEKMSCFVKIFY